MSICPSYWWFYGAFIYIYIYIYIYICMYIYMRKSANWIMSKVIHLHTIDYGIWDLLICKLSKRVWIICLLLRETYIVFPSVYVCPSVRASVRLSVTLTLSEPISPRTFRAKNLQKIPKIIYLLKLCNKKLKFNFAKNFGSFGQKTTFWICDLSRPDLGNYNR